MLEYGWTEIAKHDPWYDFINAHAVPMPGNAGPIEEAQARPSVIKGVVVGTTTDSRLNEARSEQ